MNAAAPTIPPTRRQTRRVLLVLATVAAFPFVASWLLYFNPHWLPQPSAQHGKLLSPPIAQDGLALHDLEGRPFTLDPGRNDWLLLVVEPAACDEACRGRHTALRQARRAAGIEKTRVVRVIAFGAPPDTATRTQLRADSPDLELVLAGPELARLAGSEPTLLIGDARGDLVMRYAFADVAPKDVLKDLKRLLRVSRSW
jgi:cytochrome oxidase Cu insertion factor (SCO1/SenC/PrrC family)